MHKTSIYDHGLTPLQNSIFILATKTLLFDRFSKFLQVLLRQTEVQTEAQILNRKYFHAFQQSNILANNLLSEVSFYTLILNAKLKSD